MKKLYPLTAAQNMHYRWIKTYKTQQVSGVSIVAALKLEMDFALLKRCINMEIKRYKCLGLRFTKPDENGEIKQYLVNTVPRSIKLLKLDTIPFEKADATLQNMAYTTLDGDDIPMYEFFFVMLPEGYNGFFVHMDHRLIDSCGLAVMVEDIIKLYAHFKYDREYPEDLADFETVLESDLSKASNEKRFQRAKKFWDDQLDTLGEPLYSDITGPSSLEESRKKHGNPDLRSCDIEKENLFVTVKDYKLEEVPSKHLFEFCEKNQISLNNLLLLTMRTYLSKVNNGQEDISIQNFIARRSTHDEWTSGGSRTIMYPCRTVIPNSTSFIDAARQVQKHQNNVYLHSYYDPELIYDEIKKRYGTPEDTTYESCYLTYQPMSLSSDNPDLKDIPFYFKWYANGAATKKMYLTVTHTPDGGLNFSYHYQTAHLVEKDVELFYYYMMKILFMGVETPEMALDEIIERV